MAENRFEVGSVPLKPLAGLAQQTATIKTQNNWIHNILAGGLAFMLLVIAYNLKDLQKAITRSEIVTNSVTILGDDGQPQFVIDKFGICKVHGTDRTKIIDNIAGHIEVLADTVIVDNVRAKDVKTVTVEADLVDSGSYVLTNKLGNKIKIEDHLYTPKPVGDAR